MKVIELISLLEQYDENMEVVIAHQPNYPLQASIQGVSDAPLADDEEKRDLVYVVAGASTEYAPREVFDTVAW
jgi:hypothetical protein